MWVYEKEDNMGRDYEYLRIPSDSREIFTVISYTHLGKSPRSYEYLG